MEITKSYWVRRLEPESWLFASAICTYTVQRKGEHKRRTRVEWNIIYLYHERIILLHPCSCLRVVEFWSLQDIQCLQLEHERLFAVPLLFQTLLIRACQLTNVWYRGSTVTGNMCYLTNFIWISKIWLWKMNACEYNFFKTKTTGTTSQHLIRCFVFFYKYELPVSTLYQFHQQSERSTVKLIVTNLR